MQYTTEALYKFCETNNITLIKIHLSKGGGKLKCNKLFTY